MEQSRQLLWQGQRRELILVSFQQAHLLPAKHKALSHHPHITPNNQLVIFANADRTELGLSSRRREQQVEVLHIAEGWASHYVHVIIFWSFCVRESHLPHVHTF